MGNQQQEFTGRVEQGDRQRLCIGGLDSHLCPIGLHPGEVFDRVDDAQRRLVRVRTLGDANCRGAWCQQSLVGPLEVIGRDRIAIRPFRGRADLEGVGKAIGRYLPRFCLTGNDIVAFLVGQHETFQQRGADKPEAVSYHMRIEIGEIGEEEGSRRALLCCLGRHRPRRRRCTGIAQAGCRDCSGTECGNPLHQCPTVDLCLGRVFHAWTPSD
jgi:hypothetical protein